MKKAARLYCTCACTRTHTVCATTPTKLASCASQKSGADRISPKYCGNTKHTLLNLPLSLLAEHPQPLLTGLSARRLYGKETFKTGNGNCSFSHSLTSLPLLYNVALKKTLKKKKQEVKKSGGRPAHRRTQGTNWHVMTVEWGRGGYNLWSCASTATGSQSS